jgi:hypothetical protein
MNSIVKFATLPFAGILIAATLVQPAVADVVNVTPTNMGDWAFVNSDVNGTVGNNPTGFGAMVVGPGMPPIGIGSANLVTGNGTVGGDGAEILSTTGYAGVALSSLTALNYSTFVTKNNGSQFPVLEIEIATGLTGPNAFDQLFFEPPYQTPTSGNPSLPNQGATALNTWQSWNALSGGLWDNDGITGCGAPGSGVASLASCISAIDATGGDPTIVNNFGTPGVLDGVGGVQFFVGFASPTDQFDGNVDDFTIGVNGVNTTFNFDPVPEPASWSLFGIGLLSFGFAWRRYGGKSSTHSALSA